MKNDLYKLLEDYILKYIPLEKGYSKNTAITYYTSIKQYLDFLEIELSKKNKSISILDFDKENILLFLGNLENKGNSISTRNNRLACLLSFIKYVSEIEPLYINVYNQITTIKSKKKSKEVLDFLTIDEYKSFIKSIDLATKQGLRHYTIVNLLYDTGARVSELINIKVEDLNYGSQNTIKLDGKGNKKRLVYITIHTVKILNNYLDKYNIKNGYIFVNEHNDQLTRFGIQYIIKKYYKIACLTETSLNAKTVSAHTFRHTKACHLLLNGTALPVIQKFLGHSSVQTTEIYLEVTSESIVEAIEKSAISILSDEIPENIAGNKKIMQKIHEIFQD